jgi:thiol-disulfide isomerase/thioredoxin
MKFSFLPFSSASTAKVALVFVAALFGNVAATDDNGNSDVIELNMDNFEDLTAEGIWLIEFYGPSCGFCKMLEPEWEKLAKEVEEDEIDMHVAKINVRESPELSKKFAIGKLPGIKLLRDGSTYTLPNARTARSQDEYIEYAMETFEAIEQEELDRIAEEVRVQAEIDARSHVVKLELDTFEDQVAEGTWLIDFYGPKCGYCKKLAPIWEDLADKVDAGEHDFKVAKFDAAAGFQYTRQFKANPWPSIKLLKDGLIYTFPESRNFELSLQDYIDFAEAGFAADEEPIVPEFIEAAKKRRERKKKYSKWKKGKKPEPAAHDEL